MNDMALDLQRSQKDAPVYNSENHLIGDEDTEPLPPEHVRAALWQAAVHGQGATTIWIWQRSMDPNPGNDVPGSLMYRPACAEAVGRVDLDLNRAAEEVTALQQARPDVWLVQSVSSSVWEPVRISTCSSELYTALAFTGLKIGFVTERQLEAGHLPGGPIFIPDVVHLSAAAFRTLSRHRGPLFLVGPGDILTRDDADNPRVERLQGARIPFIAGRTNWRDIRRALPARIGGARPAVEARDAAGRDLWGVEWHAARTQADAVVSLCNYQPRTVTVSLSSGGNPFAGTDVLTGRRVRGPFSLRPMEIRILRGKQ
jgi:hypothetical protein